MERRLTSYPGRQTESRYLEAVTHVELLTRTTRLYKRLLSLVTRKYTHDDH